MSKLALSLLCVVLAAAPGYSQWQIGLQGGVARNQLSTETAYFTYTRYLPQTGLHIGVPVRYAIADWVAIRTGAELTEKNYRQERTGFFDGLYQNTRNRYLTLPLGVEFSFGVKRWKGYCGFGGYAAYWTDSRIQGRGVSVFASPEDQPADGDQYTSISQLAPVSAFRENYVFDRRKDRRFEAGWTTSAGVRYAFPACQVFLEAQYRYSLTDQQKNYMLLQIPRYNQTILLTTGVLFHLSASH